MDVLPELLASALVPKTESTGNNKKQKNKHYENSTKKAEVEDVADDDTEKAKLVEKRSNWVEKDRRSTNDRRKQMAKRGRWLESRDSKDRRRSTNTTISITI